MAKSQPLCTNALIKSGWTVGKTEVYNTFSHKYQDLFGIIDAVGIHDELDSIVFFQFCKADYAPHINKILTNPIIKKIVHSAPFVLVGVIKKGSRYVYRFGIINTNLEYVEHQEWKDEIKNLDGILKTIKE